MCKVINNYFRSTFYVEERDAWCDLKTKVEVLKPSTFQAIFNSIGVWGLASVDKILGHMIVAEMSFFLQTIHSEIVQDRTNLDHFGKIAKTLNSSELIGKLI